jgi:hypothetical protein
MLDAEAIFSDELANQMFLAQLSGLGKVNTAATTTTAVSNLHAFSSLSFFNPP